MLLDQFIGKTGLRVRATEMIGFMVCKLLEGALAITNYDTQRMLLKRQLMAVFFASVLVAKLSQHLTEEQRDRMMTDAMTCYASQHETNSTLRQWKGQRETSQVPE